MQHVKIALPMNAAFVSGSMDKDLKRQCLYGQSCVAVRIMPRRITAYYHAGKKRLIAPARCSTFA